MEGRGVRIIYIVMTTFCKQQIPTSRHRKIRISASMSRVRGKARPCYPAFALNWALASYVPASMAKEPSFSPPSLCVPIYVPIAISSIGRNLWLIPTHRPHAQIGSLDPEDQSIGQETRSGGPKENVVGGRHNDSPVTLTVGQSCKHTPRRLVNHRLQTRPGNLAPSDREKLVPEEGSRGNS